MLQELPNIFYDALRHEGKPDLGPRMAIVYESFEINRALANGNLRDADAWREIERYIGVYGGREKVAAITLNPEVYGPGFELDPAERLVRYRRVAQLVTMVKAEFGVPVGVYCWPPVIWPQHGGASDEYAESLRQAKVLMDAVDFYAPSAYMAAWWCRDRRGNGRDMRYWRLWNQTILDRLRSELTLTYNWTWTYTNRKPIYPFLAPVYEYGVEPREWFGKSIGKARLAEQLAWCRAHADGAVLWGGSDLGDPSGNGTLKWSEGWQWIGEAMGLEVRA